MVIFSSGIAWLRYDNIRRQTVTDIRARSSNCNWGKRLTFKESSIDIDVLHNVSALKLEI